MNGSLSVPAGPMHAELARRCAALGVAIWVGDEGGRFKLATNSASPPDSWFNAKPLQIKLESAARQWLQDRAQRSGILANDSADIVQLFGGCQLIFLPEPGGLSIAMVLEESATGQPDFQEIAEAAGMDATEIPLRRLKRTGFDLNQLHLVVRSFHSDLSQAAENRHVIGEFNERLSQSYEEAQVLFRMARFINSLCEPADVMEIACNQLKEVLPFRWMAMWFRDAAEVLPALAGKLIVAGELPCANTRLVDCAAALCKQESTDQWTRVLTPSSNELAALCGTEIVAEPISHDGRCVGILLAGNKTTADTDISSPEMQLLDAVTDFLGVFHENMARFAEQQIQFLGSLRALTAAIDAKDAYTRGHSDRVGTLAFQMATALALPAEEAEQYRIAGLVHDVGKIGVPESALCKAGKLSEEEFSQIKRHPLIGFHILKDIPSMTPMLPGVLHHHERWDGRGYPDALAGPDIPLIARVLALADTFDAMSSTRSYRQALSREHVLGEIAGSAGTQFDPALVPLFVAMDFGRFDEMLAGVPIPLAVSAATKTLPVRISA